MGDTSWGQRRRRCDSFWFSPLLSRQRSPGSSDSASCRRYWTPSLPSRRRSWRSPGCSAAGCRVRRSRDPEERSVLQTCSSRTLQRRSCTTGTRRAAKPAQHPQLLSWWLRDPPSVSAELRGNTESTKSYFSDDTKRYLIKNISDKKLEYIYSYKTREILLI